MSKWCGDENCLQCADKEPDPYVHLPREEYVALREQNRVLREALQEIASDIKGNPKRKQMLADDDFWAAPGEHTLRQWIAQAAITATSQPKEVSE